MDELAIQCNNGNSDPLYCVSQSNQSNHEVFANNYKHDSLSSPESSSSSSVHEQSPQAETKTISDQSKNDSVSIESERLSNYANSEKASEVIINSNHKENYPNPDSETSFCDQKNMERQLIELTEQLAEAKSTIEIMQKQLEELESTGTKADKMKMLAVKLKRELASSREELIKVQQSEKEAKEQLRSINREYDKVSSSYQQSVRNFQTLQAEYDRLQDEFDQCKDKAKSISSDFNSSVTELSKVKEEYAEKLMENDLLFTKINGLKDMITEYEKKTQDMESTIIVLKSELEAERRQKLDNVELERTVQELRTQLESKCSQVSDFEEQAKKNEQLHKDYQLLKPQYDELVKDKHTLEQENEQLKCNISDITKKLELCTSELEEERLKYSQIASEKVNLLGKFRISEEQYSRKFKSQEEKISQLEGSIVLAEEELKRKDAEFESYKIRVTKLLNQNKQQEPKENEEIKQLKRQLESFRLASDTLENKLNEEINNKSSLVKQLQEKIDENNDLVKEIEKSASKNEEIQRLENLIENLRQYNVNEREKYEKQRQQIEETHRSSESSLRKEISELESKISSLKEEIASLNQLNQSLTNFRTKEPSPTPSSPPVEHLHHSPTLNTSDSNFKTDYESSDNCSQADTAHRTPLSSFSSSKSPALMINPLLEILSSRDESEEEEVIKYLKQIGDLTQLLKDSESNNALITEQNRVLKDEIRRLQRSIERVEVAQNLEYLKNVLVKFVSTDADRAQLVPVLTTILRLSKPEEEAFTRFATPNLNQTNSNAGPSNQQTNWYIWPSFS